MVIRRLHNHLLANHGGKSLSPVVVVIPARTHSFPRASTSHDRNGIAYAISTKSSYGQSSTTRTAGTPCIYSGTRYRARSLCSDYGWIVHSSTGIRDETFTISDGTRKERLYKRITRQQSAHLRVQKPLPFCIRQYIQLSTLLITIFTLKCLDLIKFASRRLFSQWSGNENLHFTLYHTKDEDGDISTYILSRQRKMRM